MQHTPGRIRWGAEHACESHDHDDHPHGLRRDDGLRKRAGGGEAAAGVMPRV